MHLEKLEIQGFKSFASKTILSFPGLIEGDRRGITSIVGPNGSGKSNIADAVRWVLGEQSAKLLRGKKSEDVIFSGTEKKDRLNMAAVSLYLNNEDKAAPIDHSQIVITRRVFRDGSSEYLINSAKARLLDVQLLLAKANFGQRTYSVTGQGMVEGFLNTTPAERKLFFDEATGVKQFQIKRDDALNKLKNAQENLSQAKLITAEIEPRLKNLERQAEKLEQKGRLEKDLRKLQVKYYAKIWHEINDKFLSFSENFLAVEKTKNQELEKLEILNKELLQAEQNQNNQEELIARSELAKLEAQKNELAKQIARLEAQLEASLEQQGKFDLSWLYTKKEELGQSQDTLNQEIEELAKSLEPLKIELNNFQEQQKKLNQEISLINQNIAQVNANIGGPKEAQINQELTKLLDQIGLAEAEGDLEKLKNILAQIKIQISDALALLEDRGQKEKLKNLELSLSRISAQKEKELSEQNEVNFKLISKQERLRMLKEKKAQIIAEANNIQAKLNRAEQAPDVNKQGIGDKLNNLNSELEKLSSQISAQKLIINNLQAASENQRKEIFAKQKAVQALQQNANQIQARLNEIKIQQTRQETRLEDLETEIRAEFRESFDFGNKTGNQEENIFSLKTIKEARQEAYLDLPQAQEEIKKIKRQLEVIGSIDPEIVKEYQEIKERFDFLTNQSNDLISAIESLEKISKDLDRTIREKFDAQFELIDKNFQEYFKVLFNGGSAKIVKILAEETEEISQERTNFSRAYNATGLAGIDLEATPPGKKIQSVSMLSGGERALTAIALICACLFANPSPFVVLDEVDAALDESNSERLAKILDKLSHKTQFIAITHNRAIMRRANVLYGVTMEDSGVSKLLSIKLEDVKIK